MNACIRKLHDLAQSVDVVMTILTVALVFVVLSAVATQFTTPPALTEDTPAPVATNGAAGTGTRVRRCPDCGVVESMRDVAGTQPEHGREITIRLQDGSMRVITDANPANWRYGERVSIIPGTN